MEATIRVFSALAAALARLALILGAVIRAIFAGLQSLLPAKVIAPEEARQADVERRVDDLLENEMAAVKTMSPAQSAAAHAALNAELSLGERTKQRLLDAKQFAGTDASDIRLRLEGERILRHLDAGDLRGLKPQIRAALKGLGKGRCLDLLEAGDPYATANAVAGWIAVNEVVKRQSEQSKSRLDARPYAAEAAVAGLRM